MKTITRRTFGAFALAASTMLASGTAYAADAIKVGLLSLTSHSPSIIAEAKGYFAEQDLEVEFVTFQAAQPMAVAIASQDVDFGVTAISGGLISLADDLEILISRHVNDQEGVRAMVNRTGRALAPNRLSQRPHPRFLGWHRDNCFKQ